MAYREFHNETPYEAPVIGDLPRQLQALQFTQQQKQLRQQKRIDRFNDYDQFVATGKNPYYNSEVNRMSGEVTKDVQNDFNKGLPTVSSATKMKMEDVKAINSEAKANEEEVANLHQQIMDTANKDKYFDPTESLKENANLIGNDGTPLTREKLREHRDRISNQRQSIYSPNNVLRDFKANDYASDFVQGYKEAKKTQEESFKGANGAKQSTLYSGLFFDDKGKPGVTPEIVQKFLNGHPMNNAYYTELAMNDLAKDADSALAGDPNFGKKLTDAPVKSPEWYHDIVASFTHDPSSDPIDKRPVNERARAKAKKVLEEYEATTRKIDTDLSDVNPSSEAGITSKDVGSSEVFQGQVDYSTPGRSLTRTKPATNPYFKFTSRAPIRLDTDSGKVTADNLPRDFIVNTVEVVPVNSSGIPIGFKADNTDELIQQINKAPLSMFGSNGITGVKMALRGQSVDKSVIDEAYKQKEQLEAQAAQNPENPALQQKLSFLNEQLDKYANGENPNFKFLEDLTGKKALHQELMPINPGDVNTGFIKDQTGADVYSQKFQSKDMQRVTEAINRRVAEAKATPAKEQPITGPTPETSAIKAQAEPVKITSDEDYDKLPSGAIFIAPDGYKRKKP